MTPSAGSPLPPLLSVFMELRRRDYPLGAAEYMVALKALAAGFGADSPEALGRACAVLWAKSLEDQLQIQRIVVRALEKGGRAPPSPPGRRHESEPEAPSDEDRATGGEATTPETPEVIDGAPAPGAVAEGGVDVGEGVEGADGAGNVALVEGDFSGIEPDGTLAINPEFDLVPNLPVAFRTMKAAWRGYRRPGRAGPKTEVDIHAALDIILHHGRLIEFPMRAPRSNRARLLLLVDEGGSMVPFRYITDAVVRSLRMAGLSQLEVRFFHDVPGERVFRTPDLRGPQELDAATGGFVDQGILVFGDAGAARRTMDRARVEESVRLVARLRAVTPTVAWLNPVPRRRWRGTSAEQLRLEADVPMFPVTGTGLRSAVGTLHGQVR